MNATTIDAPRAKVAAKRTRQAQAQPAVVAVNHASLFGSLFEVIDAAWAIDDMAYPTDACILLKMAKDIAHDSRNMVLNEIGVQSAAYEIAALLKAVTSMPDQSRNGMLEPAYPLLAILAEDPDVMDREPWTYGTRSPAPGTKKAEFERLHTLLDAAAAMDSGNINCGDSIRLLRAAADMAYDAWSGRITDPDVSDAVCQENGFNIAALVAASVRVPGDPTLEERRPLLAPVIELLAKLTGAQQAVDLRPAPTMGPNATTDLQQEALWEIDGLCDMLVAFEKTVSNEDSSARTGAIRRIKSLAGIATYCHSHITGDARDDGAPPVDEMRSRFNGYY